MLTNKKLSLLAVAISSFIGILISPVLASNNYTLEYSSINHDGPAGLSASYDTRDRMPAFDLYSFLAGSVDYSVQSILGENPLQNAEIEVRQNGVLLPRGGGPIDFGQVPFGSAPPERVFTIINVGTTDLFTGRLTLPDGFSVSDPPAGRIEPGASDAMALTMATDAAGTRSGTLQFNHNDTPLDPYFFTIAGEVFPKKLYSLQYASLNHDAGPHATLAYGGEDVLPLEGSGGLVSNSLSYQFQQAAIEAPLGEAAIVVRQANTRLVSGAGTIDFGKVGPGEAFPYKYFKVANAGNVYLAVELISTPAGFQVLSGSVLSVPPAQERQFALALQTTAKGTFTGTLQLKSNDADQTPFAINVTGAVVDVVWVNFGHSGAEDGSQAKPFNTIAEGIGAAPAGGIVRMQPGSTAAAVRITKKLRLESSGGTARIGRN